MNCNGGRASRKVVCSANIIYSAKMICRANGVTAEAWLHGGCANAVAGLPQWPGHPGRQATEVAE